jgi:uncharacterized protein YeeX (DUF496 family)
LANKVPEKVVNYLHKLNSVLPELSEKLSPDMSEEQKAQALENMRNDREDQAKR